MQAGSLPTHTHPAVTLPRNSLWGPDPHLLQQHVSWWLGLSTRGFKISSGQIYPLFPRRRGGAACAFLCAPALSQASAHLEGNLSVSFQPRFHSALGGKILKVFSGEKLSNNLAMGGTPIALPRSGPFIYRGRPWRAQLAQAAAAQAGSAPSHHGLPRRYPGGTERPRGGWGRARAGESTGWPGGFTATFSPQDPPGLPCSCSAVWEPCCPSTWLPSLQVT